MLGGWFLVGIGTLLCFWYGFIMKGIVVFCLDVWVIFMYILVEGF